MIRVDRLTKRYGTARGVDGISFEVGRGEIVGLLGPNGAGKTTTMRMLTTYLTPTSGRAEIDGYDVLDRSPEVRKRVGYLPENVPLYQEMRVSEYLSFRSKLKDVPRSKRKAAIDRVVERCKLKEVENRILGQLSKGFRQRVGLAESLIHDPIVLILDEPTAGLDPLQVLEVRTLIRELGETQTVLLSTHILTEVEAVCRRMLIVSGGKIVDDFRIDAVEENSTIVIELKGPHELIHSMLSAFPGVSKVKTVQHDGEYHTFEIETRDDLDLREDLASLAQKGGRSLRRLDRRRFSLEDRFIEVVSRAALAAGPERKAV